MPANYKYYDAFGIERTVTNVLEPLELEDVEVTSTSNIITVAEASVVYPGQPISCFGLPLGTFVHSVRKSTGNPTQLTLWASVFDLASGAWTTSATNANATASASGITAVVSGYCPFTVVTLAYAMGMWRNIHTKTNSLYYGTAGAQAVANVAGGAGIAAVPSAITWTTGFPQITAGAINASDDLAATVKKRHNGELHGAYILVSTSGHKSVVQAMPGREILYSPT